MPPPIEDIAEYLRQKGYSELEAEIGAQEVLDRIAAARLALIEERRRLTSRFSAVGDGITDDTAAIQAHIDRKCIHGTPLALHCGKCETP